MIQEGFPTHEWITRVADDERRRDAVIALATNAAAREAALVTKHGRQLLQALTAIIAGDVARFRQEFPDDPARHTMLDVAADEGFEVRRSAYPTVALSLTPQWTLGLVACRYRFRPGADLPVREDRFTLGLTPSGDDACFKHQGSGEVFARLPALSE